MERKDLDSIDPSKGNVVIMHGWQNSGDHKDGQAWIRRMSDAAQQKYPDRNIIVVDWEDNSKTINYLHSANQVNHLGSYVAKRLLLHMMLTQAKP